MTRTNPPPIPQTTGPGLTGLGKLVSFLLVIGLIGLGLFVMKKVGGKGGQSGDATVAGQQGGGGTSGREAQADPGPPAEALADLMEEVPKLDPPAPYLPKGDTIE